MAMTAREKNLRLDVRYWQNVHRFDDDSVAKRITESIAAPFEIKGHHLSIGISIGITIYPHDDHPIDELLKHADTAMYRAKQQGGSAFHLHEASGTQSSNLLP